MLFSIQKEKKKTGVVEVRFTSSINMFHFENLTEKYYFRIFYSQYCPPVTGEGFLYKKTPKFLQYINSNPNPNSDRPVLQMGQKLNKHENNTLKLGHVQANICSRSWNHGRIKVDLNSSAVTDLETLK